MRDMFDIRLARYLPEADTPRADFWNTNNQVVASMQTLRDGRKDRHKRILRQSHGISLSLTRLTISM
jgi:hypothetical protein